MTQIAPLLLRADADAQPGNSHLVRLLALGSAWQARGGQVVCLGHVASPVMQQRIRQTGATFIPLRCRYPHPDDLAIVSQQIALMHQQAGPDGTVWTAVDGHHFDVEYQGEIRALGSRLLVIDDLADACRYDADLVLNQNPGIDERRYTGSVGSETTLLLGARYALLPPRFGRYRPLRAAVSEVARSVLIAFDGADPLDLTSKALAAVEQAAVPHLRVRVLVGASNRHTAALRAWARRRPGQVELVFAPFNRAAEMAAADMAVTAAGDTCFELACMQTPALVIATTPAQAPTAQAMARAGAMIDLGPARELSMQHMAAAVQSLGLSPQARSRQIDFGRALVDGVGAARVTAVMRALDGELTPDDIALRPLDSTDCWPLWRTKPGLSLHLNSHATDPIPPDEHRRWFGEKLASETARIWVASLHGLIWASSATTGQTPRRPRSASTWSARAGAAGWVPA